MEGRSMEEKSRKIYLEGLQKYRDKGITIRIDGKEVQPDDWEKIFEFHEDGSFYMGDYILEEKEEGGKTLKEIRFDKVYYK